MAAVFTVALLLDLGVGDPAWRWHPVRLIGRLVSLLEARALRRGSALRRRGIGLVLLVVGLTWLLSFYGLQLVAQLDGSLGLGGWLLLAASAALLKSSFAVRDLIKHAVVVYRELAAGDLNRARVAVARMVGRDVSSLDEAGIRRACLESVSESFGDGVVAPLFYALLGGPALALAYRAINTLDSMVGYKHEPYADLGWAAARLDDLANFIPARLAVLLTAAAAAFMGLDSREALRTAWVDGPLQPSPNAGWPEGAFAGALGVQLGGPVSYGGKVSSKPTLGQPRLALDAKASRLSVWLFALASLLTVALAAAASTL